MLKGVKSSDIMLCLEEEYSYIRIVEKKKRKNGMTNLHLYYTVLKGKKRFCSEPPYKCCFCLVLY